MKLAISALSALMILGAFAHADAACTAAKGQVRRQGWASLNVVQNGHAQNITAVASSHDCFDSKQDAYQVKVDIGTGCYLNVCANSAFEAGQWEQLGWATFLNP